MQLRPTRAPAWFTRTLSLRRNARQAKSTTRTATGINAARVVQKSMGMTGGSFNTREFFRRPGPRPVRGGGWASRAARPGAAVQLGAGSQALARWPRRRPACWPSAGSSSHIYYQAMS